MNIRRRSFRRICTVISVFALVTTVLSACQSDPPQQQPNSAPTTTLNPMGPNSFTPTVIAPGPRTALPGNIKTG